MTSGSPQTPPPTSSRMSSPVSPVTSPPTSPSTKAQSVGSLDKITPPETYFNRRTLLKTGLLAASAVATGFVYRQLNRVPGVTAEQPKLAGFESFAAAPTTGPAATQSTASAAIGPNGASSARSAHSADSVSPSMAKAFHASDPQTPYQKITNYNNYYEFSTDKEGVAGAIGDFSSAGWKVKIDGLVKKPGMYDMDDILKVARPEERVYRMRCVEAWSMVIPWAGYSLSKLLDRVEPLSSAKYVAFTTIYAPKMMPGQKTDVLQWPYVEGLRMDEAMHPLTLLTLGLYGRQLPVQDGAPVRIVIPWKYGFKGIKAIVKISLVADMPPSTWNIAAPDEYGFYANVNPDVPHPRWSQATEDRLGVGRIPTQKFNGYGEQVASLYKGMDLHKYF